MKTKVSIKEIEEMLPDFISGTLNEGDRQKVERALSENSELKSLYLEYKKTFDFVGSVKFEEPPDQYWNTLLPRIHDRIESKKESKSWLSPGNVWKVLLPVAALVLIFIVYKTISSPGPEITKKQVVDTVKTIQQQPEIKVKEPENTEKITEVKKEKIVRAPQRHTSKEIVPVEKQNMEKTEEPQIAKDETGNGRDEELASNEIFNNITSSVDDVETIYEESEKEYNKLTSTEKSEVLDKLKEIDL